MIKKLYIIFILLLSLLGSKSLYAQVTTIEDPTLTRILFVFDGSQSMYGRWESGQKIDIAQQLMTKMLDSLQSLNSDAFQLALRVYGHQKPVPPQDCNDTRLEVAFSSNNIGRIKKVLRGIKPKGTTPIARSLMKATSDFSPCDNCRNVIILITDGIESCDEDPCASSRFLQQKGIALKPFVIGIGLDEQFKESFECVGNYYDAEDEDTFSKVLGIVISQALDNTSAQINLLDKNGNPTETDVPITFYDQMSGKVAKQLIHTINYKGRPDTISLDPLMTYTMTVHSIPEKTIKDVKIAPGKHNHIGMDLPRGTLELKITQRNGYDNLKAIVRQSSKSEILHVQDFNSAEKYVQGNYDLEILTLPRFVQKNFYIEGNKTTTLTIPPPGVVNFSSSAPGYGSILIERENKYEWVIDLNEKSARQNITLQPGNYRVAFRSSRSQSSAYSIIKSFTVSSGSTTFVKLN